jgi:dihydrolipoamide dehydrogenase
VAATSARVRHFFSEIGAEVNVFEMLPQIASRVRQRRVGPAPANAQAVRDDLQPLLPGRWHRGGQRSLRRQFGREDTYAADCILNATGRAPSSGLGLEEVGVDFSTKGVRISDQGKTSVPGVWACGDVTGQYMLAHVATREGIVAVNSMFGRSGPGPL